MYRQIYRDKILYYVATQHFNSPKKPRNKHTILRYAEPTPGVPPLLSVGLLLLPSITNLCE